MDKNWIIAPAAVVVLGAAWWVWRAVPETEAPIPQNVTPELLARNAVAPSSEPSAVQRLKSAPSSVTPIERAEQLNSLRGAVIAQKSEPLRTEKQMLARTGTSVSFDVAQAMFDRGTFNDYLKRMGDEMVTDALASELGDLYGQALQESVAAAEFQVTDFACGRALCVGTAEAMNDNASWNAAVDRFGEAYGGTYSSIGSSRIFENGRSVQQFILSIDPVVTGVHFRRVPTTGIVFGRPPEDIPPPPPPGG